MAFDFASMLQGGMGGMGGGLPFAQLGGMMPPSAAMLAGPGGMPTGAPPAPGASPNAPTPEQIQQMMQQRGLGMGAMMGGAGAPGLGQPPAPPTAEMLAGPGGMPTGAPAAPQASANQPTPEQIQQMMMRMGPQVMAAGQGQAGASNGMPFAQMMQQSQQQGPRPGVMPTAGMGGGMSGARGGPGGLGQGFMGAGGGVAPRRIVNPRGTGF